MPVQNKPTLAIVCNYADNSCGVAAYARTRRTAFSEYFDVTVFDLESAALMRPAALTPAADKRIDEICASLPGFDFVSVDLEFGIWGDTLERCERRVRKCCAAAKRLLFTVHRIDIDGAKSGAFALAQARIFREIAQRPADRPYHIIVHSEDEAQTLRSVHGFADVSSHPLAYMTVAERAASQTSANPVEWKKSLGFDGKDVVIGVFGAMSKYKDTRTVIKAFQHLPEKYKLLFVGGAHPFSMKPFRADDNVVDILTALADAEAARPGLLERVRFSGVVEDDAFRRALQNCDIVVLPYYDAGQLSSGVAAMAFDLGKQIVATHTMLFLGYRALYGESFEMFDVGNYLELRDRIMFFRPERVARMKSASSRYTPESMALLVSRIGGDMLKDGFRNRCDLAKLGDLVRALEFSTSLWQRVPRKVLAYARGRLGS